ncbi:biotin--[acetyl-CoA-carboxylase] ligase [Dehalococcoidales bacterium]|nr:biotin--[acetyl-CoA-carboxylase] ligase [Dehalococcoidales bacterium]
MLTLTLTKVDKTNYNSVAMESKFRIVNMLHQEYISGEELAKRLDVSRTAVWKQIQELKKADFVIEAKPRLGYKIVSYPDKLLPIMIEKGLRTSIIGRSIYYYQTIDSTNSLAKKLAQEGAVEGSLVVAEEQVAGRGRCGRCWVSPKGVNILASIILRPNILPHQMPQLAILGAISVADSIGKKTGLNTELRWPNEILVNNKRVGGILTEFGAELDRVDFVILGIGINVNFDLAEFPELAGEATSLWMETGVKVSRIELLQILLEQIENNYTLLTEGKFHQLWQRWNSLCWGRDKWVQVASTEGKESGILKGMDESGCLILARVDGERRIAMSGDVSLRTG